MNNGNKCIVVLGCFDTKGEDFSYLISCIRNLGQSIITINTGIMETNADFEIDHDSEQVAALSGAPLKHIRLQGDRGKAVELMGTGASRIISTLISKNQVKGVIGMGGGGGTYIALAAMQEVPLGIPKLCLSTVATKDLSRQVGVKDIILMPSVVDVAGLNGISRLLIKRAAAALCGMVDLPAENTSTSTKSIAISMFGNTTKCVDQCTSLLKQQGYEVLSFHATGVGGATMESLIREGCFDAVLDITTTELADELCGGILSAGPDRLTAASDKGIPQVVVPGCLDMVNFAQMDTVPEKYNSRLLYSWAPDVTLMRTNEQENEILGRELAYKLNSSKGEVVVVIPLKGISQLDSKGGIFYKPEIDDILFNTIKDNVNSNVKVIESDAHINDMKFAETLVENLLAVIRKGQT